MGAGNTKVNSNLAFHAMLCQQNICQNKLQLPEIHHISRNFMINSFLYNIRVSNPVGSRAILYLWLSNISANEMWHCKCNKFCHWMRPCWIMHWKLGHFLWLGSSEGRGCKTCCLPIDYIHEWFNITFDIQICHSKWQMKSSKIMCHFKC